MSGKLSFFSQAPRPKKIDPTTSLRSYSDEEKAKELISFLPPGSEERLRNQTIDLINENWEQIRAVATALLEDKTLQHEEWSLIISAVDQVEDWRKLLSILRQRL